MAEYPLKPLTARVFLAIPLQGIFFREVESILNPLRREIPAVRWAEPRQVHLTLHFFGVVPTKELDLIHLFSEKVASLFLPLTLRLAQIGGFPNLERPDIVWLGAEDLTGSLRSFQKAILGEVRTLGFKSEDRPFQPHVTIGRVKRKSTDLKPLLAKVGCLLPTPEKKADHFALYQSHNLPEGARYEILKTYAFSRKT